MKSMIHPNCLHHIEIGLKLGYIRAENLAWIIKEHKNLCTKEQTQKLITSLLNLSQITPPQAKQILSHQAQTTFTVKNKKLKESSNSKKTLTKQLTELDKKYNFILNLNKNYCLKLDLFRWANEAQITLSKTRGKKELLEELKQLIGKQINDEHNEVLNLVHHCF